MLEVCCSRVLYFRDHFEIRHRPRDHLHDDSLDNPLHASVVFEQGFKMLHYRYPCVLRSKAPLMESQLFICMF